MLGPMSQVSPEHVLIAAACSTPRVCPSLSETRVTGGGVAGAGGVTVALLPLRPRPDCVQDVVKPSSRVDFVLCVRDVIKKMIMINL